MKRWRVETKATVVRHRYVEAENAKEAEAKSIGAEIDYEEDIDEQAMGVTEEAA